MWGTYLCRGSGFLHSVYLEKNERSCTANTLWVSFQCMECTTCACATHLQNTVFGEVCAVDGVFHFVFAVQGAQRGWTKVPCNFLSDGNIWIITCSLALHFNIKWIRRCDAISILVSKSVDSCESQHPVPAEWLLSGWTCDPVEEVTKQTLSKFSTDLGVGASVLKHIFTTAFQKWLHLLLIFCRDQLAKQTNLH